MLENIRGKKANMLTNFLSATRPEILIQDHIIYDHGGVVALNKPAGFVSRGSPDQNLLASLSGQLRCDEWPAMHHVVHRLDQFTTGVILVARTKEVAKILGQQFEAHTIKKTYWALIDGVPKKPSGTIYDPIPFFKKNGVVQHKPAVTEYHTLQTNGLGMSFVCFQPQTGRAHQLRIHAAESLKAPILGDQQYHPDFKFKAEKNELTSTYTRTVLHSNILRQMQGQMLHARSIAFTHPLTRTEVLIKAPLPVERQHVWNALGFET